MAILEVPVEAINAKARELSLAKGLLALIALPFILLGLAVKAVYFAVVWAYAAVLVGWEMGPSPRRPEGG